MNLINLNGINLEQALKLGIIKSEIDEDVLEFRLKKGFNNGVIPGEQWFRNPDIWYSMTSFSNPYFTVHSELQLVKKFNKELFKFIKDKSLIFYGIGTGDTESELVKIKTSQDKYAEILGIDAIKEFLERYCSCMINFINSEDNIIIKYSGLNTLFEKLEKQDLKFDSNYKNKSHICLGTTIGNFEEDYIFPIFENMSNKDDTLILGFHLDKNLEALKQRYEDSYKFKDLITNFIKNPELDKVKFEVNKQKRQIEAWYDNTLIFHSKKFSPNRIKEIVLKYGFKSEFQCNDENSCIIGFYYDTKT